MMTIATAMISRNIPSYLVFAPGCWLIWSRGHHHLSQPLEHPSAVGQAGGAVHGPFGVRHQAKHTAVGGQNACDVIRRAVGVVFIGKGDPVLALQLCHNLRRRMKIAIVMGDREDDALAFGVAFGEGAVRDVDDPAGLDCGRRT